MGEETISQDMRRKGEGIKIFAYGFEAAGFKIPTESLSLGFGSVHFIKLDDDKGLDSADGVIIPQGIFEKIEYEEGYEGPYTTVRVKRDLLLERERQAFNLLKDGKWVCFLVGEVVDSVPQGFHSQDIRDTDLCKRLLNAFEVYRHRIDGLSLLNAKDNEFILYIRDYGVAKTVLELPYTQDVERRVIAKAGNHVVGVEFFRQLFFLPFHTTRKDPSATTSIVTTVSQAIFDYRQKRIVEIPAWADEFQFGSEEKLRSEINSLFERVNKLQGQLRSWRDYKAILITSGNVLKNQLIRVLEDFFQSRIDPIDENREDFKIIDEGGNTLVLVESQGTKGGIKREKINQVDSHRERNNLAPSIPGVLLINNEMSVAGIADRLKTKVSDEQIEHAKRLNVLIVRTIDLLFLMRHLENNPDRQGELMKLVCTGGGWLRADSEGYEVVSECKEKPRNE